MMCWGNSPQQFITPWHRTSYDDAEEGYQEAEAALEELEEAEEEEREVRRTSTLL